MRAASRVVVLLGWAAVMVALWHRNSPRELPPAPLAEELPPEASESWHGIYRGGEKIGWVERRRVPTERGFSFESRSRMHLRMLGAPRVVETWIRAETDRRLQLERFAFRLRSGAISFAAEGRATEKALEISFPSASGNRRHWIPLSGPIVLPETLPEVVRRQWLEPGRVFHLTVFDPLGGRPAPVEVEVRGPAGPPGGDAQAGAVELLQRFRGAEFRLWVSPDGEVLREEGPLGLALLREDRETARRLPGIAESSLDLVAAAAVRASREIPEPRRRRELEIRLSGVSPELQLSFPPRQESSDGRIRIRREEILGTFRLPAREGRLAPALAAEPLVQSDDERIRRRSREILAGETDARRATEKLVDWVFRSLAKVPTASVPSAVDVLASSEGDCNEHAVLFTALARAAGLPARIVAGLVYMPSEAAGDAGFYPHAWAEVWLGEWVAVDPTFGQVPADATHVKLAEGGLDAQAALLGVLGRLAIEVEGFS
jgi:transglutaminase-like putative cysteine protease